MRQDCDGRAGGRRTWRRFKAGCWLALAVGLVMLPATAAGAEEGVGLDVQVGADGLVRPGGDLPLRVTVSADRLVHGTLNVSVEQWGERLATVEQQVEVSGGSSAEFWLLVPGPQPDLFDEADVEVSLRDGGDTLASTTVPAQFDGSNEVVAVLEGVDPAVEDLPGSVPLQVDVGSARLTTADEELLALGPRALSAFDQVVGKPEDLAALSDDAKDALALWLGDGGHLVLVGNDASALEPWLPGDWLPSSSGEGARAGLGRVRLVEGAWAQKLLPTPTSSPAEEGEVSLNMPWTEQSLQWTLGENVGAKLPGSGGLGWMLAGYVLAAGPVLFLVLHLVRRRHLAWVGVPVVAALVTAGMFATGASVRRSVKAAHVTVFETGPGGTVATTWSLVGQPRSGEPGVSLPAGWVAERGRDEAWGSSGSPVRVVADGTPEARVDTGTGGYGYIEASGPVPEMGELLSVTAESDQDDVVTGTVRNESGVPLRDVAVFVGRSAVAQIGDLAPDEEREFTVEDATTFFWASEPEAQAWPGSWHGGFVDDFEGGVGRAPDVAPAPLPQPLPEEDATSVGPSGAPAETWDEVEAEAEERAAVERELEEQAGEREPGRERTAEPAAPEPVDREPADGDATDREAADDRASMVVPPAWAQTMNENGWGFRPLGEAVAVGWTDELPTPTEPAPGSGETASTTSAVVARAAVQPAGNRLTDTASVRTMVRGPENTEPGMPGTGDLSLVWAFELPRSVNDRAVDEGRLRLRPEAAEWFDTVEVWADGRWVPLSGLVMDAGNVVLMPDPRGAQVIERDLPNQGDGRFEVPAGAVVDGRVFVRVSMAMEPPPDGGPDFTIFEEAAG